MSASSTLVEVNGLVLDDLPIEVEAIAELHRAQLASWKMMPSVCRRPVRTSLTP